ncbi:bifunctional 3-(3-hydroxy-phenyl)propionate/3-hydroxycinnamic acid hydroxylase [Pyxidicoccus fallax]|uniref:Bifunctional 3-(3-hydroxy-phenyl)propionate/3-hydroxycinnamic acid hydroxylase n=1 Tax=Pyxidicoccus fallax TaxID=394095 RepID=A0A848LHR5_9BACT|nr:bifunctional 3-(3-hydroxy-phenyl)propionate/3-hydroxycinnamic acid hydroxylase [Pyxidicoccus fallax]NMO17091.1 bifunctional 3-(3-hydroxy-phenyl)propionate/3-hydroxycinnamic acid hydroxylase [Pyxidicoccus fallax]NPC84868.1 bifunctional 3-(3-hydroxy-phenyl)propionate/3-hydroxycinnamic acid hydroxylase [Pyxidicoccus fallax]
MGCDSQQSDMQVDVIISGCGPVGALTGNLLGLMGVRTLLLERDVAPHGEPRAFSCDDEGLRIYQATGLLELLQKDMKETRFAEYVGGSGKRFAEVHTGQTDFGFGHTPLWFFHQPLLEGALRDGFQRFPHVELRQGMAFESVEQDARGVTVRYREVATGAVHSVRGRYLLACDGARSAVRKALGIEMSGKAYGEQWLAVSGTIDGPAPDLCRFVCDPKRPAFIATGARNQLRWEFMMMPGETREHLEKPETIAGLIAPYVDPKRVRIERAQVYTFHCLNAARWRERNVFLLGDAAHTMPPFMGQGLVSGMRDAANLAWKLKRVLHGQASDSLLDSYEQERRPHVADVQKLCVNVGHLFMARNPVVATLRDVFMRTVQRIPRVRRFIQGFEFKQPPLHAQGYYFGGPKVDPKAAEGSYFIQPKVRLESGEEVLLDQTLGNDFTVLCRWDAPAAELAAARELAESLGGRLVTFRPAQQTPKAEAPAVVDVTGKLTEWFSRHAADVVVLRPDRFVFGAVKAQRLPELRSALGV